MTPRHRSSSSAPPPSSAPRRALSLAGGALACCAAVACDSGYDVTLSVSDSVNTNCTTSCVQSVGMIAFGIKDGVVGDQTGDCVDVQNMQSLRDHNLHGAFDLRVPEGVTGIWVTGFRGPGCTDLAVFDGIAPVSGSTVKVPVDCVASCKDLSTMAVKTTNIIAAMQGRCEVGTATTVSAGTVRADRWDTVAPIQAQSEFTGGAPVTLVNGNASFSSVPLQVGLSRACSAVMTLTGGIPTTLACVRGYRGLCLTQPGDASKIEVATFPAQQAAATNGEIRSVVVFAERNASTGQPTPLAGARVTLDPLSPPARIVYNDLVVDGNGIPQLTVRGEQLTGPAGAFTVYSTEPVFVTVSYAGKQYRRQIGGGFFYDGPNVYNVTGAQIITPE